MQDCTAPDPPESTDTAVFCACGVLLGIAEFPCPRAKKRCSLCAATRRRQRDAARKRAWWGRAGAAAT